MFVGVWYVCCVRVCVCICGRTLPCCVCEALMMLQLLCIQMFMVTLLLLCVCWRLRAAE